MTNGFYITLAGILGLILGSFFNVVALRDRERGSIVTGRSHCPHCKHDLAWYELLPVLSFLVQAGRCRHCKKAISTRYPLVELLAACLAIFSVWYGFLERGSWVLAAGLALSLLVLLSVTLVDLALMEVPVDYVLVAGIIGGVTMVVSGQLTWQSALLGAVAGAGSLAVVLYGWLLLFHKKGMGEGDLVIAAAMGAILGFPMIFVGLMAAVFSGAILGSVLVLMRKKSYASAIPFGPFLYLGLLLALLAGQAFLRWYILYP
ncbi:MAG: prepilin peptidase [bacterium]